MDDQSKGSQTALPDKGKWILLIDKEITQVNISDSKFYAEGVNPVNDDLKETGKSRVNIVEVFSVRLEMSRAMMSVFPSLKAMFLLFFEYEKAI